MWPKEVKLMIENNYGFDLNECDSKLNVIL
jgi:hypothetical protein